MYIFFILFYRGNLDICSEFDEDFSPAPTSMSRYGEHDMNSQASIATTDEENNIDLQAVS